VPLKLNDDVRKEFERLLSVTTALDVISGQRIRWKASVWKDELKGLKSKEINDTLKEIEKYHDANDGIDRSFVFTHSESEMPLFVSSMVFGFGTTGYGAHRTSGILQRKMSKSGRNGGDSVGSVLNDVREALTGSGGDVAKALESFWRSDGTKRFHNIDVSYLTKILHFMGYNTEIRPRPLIYDAYVHMALSRIPKGPTKPLHPKAISSHDYFEYCAWSESRSDDPITVEHSLFRTGKLIR
jgi:hypothetical protein